MDFWNGRDFNSGNNNGKDGRGSGYGNGRDRRSGYGSDSNEAYGGNPRYGGDADNGCSGRNGYGEGGDNRNRGGYSDNAFGGSNTYNNSGIDREDYERKYAEYSNKSEEELMSELFRTANSMKKDGKFDISELEGFCDRAAGFLSPEQLQRMRSLINMMK